MRKLKKQWFLIGLAVALAIGFLLSEPVLTVSEPAWFRYSIVAFVLFLMSLPLEPAAIGNTFRRPWAPGLGVIFNSILLPLFAWPFAILLLNRDFGNGLLVAVAVPCTMASAAVWTRKAGGNYSAAILVTVVTNFFCFLTTPFWVWCFTGASANSAQLSLDEMIIKLAIVVVLPMLLGQLVRLIKGVGSWSTQNKISLSFLAQCGILIMVCSGAAQTARKMQSSESQFELDSFLLMLFAVNVIHVSILFAGVTSAKLFGLSREDQIAVGFAGSQKTLMVGLAVAMDIGVSILPMLVYHVSQLFVDTVIADRFARQATNRSAEPLKRGNVAKDRKN